MELHQMGSGWMLGKDSLRETNWALIGIATQGSDRSPKLMEFKELLDNALRHRVCIFGGSLWNQESESMWVPSNRICYDTMIL